MAKGRQYHTVFSSHHFKLQACVDSKGVMYLRTDARHNKGSTLVTYRVGTPPNHWVGSGSFGSVPGRLTYQGGQTVTGSTLVRFRVTLPGFKHAKVKDIRVPRFSSC